MSGKRDWSRGYSLTRGRERPRWGAKRQAATCVAEDENPLCPAQAGHRRPRPPARAFTPSDTDAAFFLGTGAMQ